MAINFYRFLTKAIRDFNSSTERPFNSFIYGGRLVPFAADEKCRTVDDVWQVSSHGVGKDSVAVASEGTVLVRYMSASSLSSAIFRIRSRRNRMNRLSPVVSMGRCGTFSSSDKNLCRNGKRILPVSRLCMPAPTSGKRTERGKLRGQMKDSCPSLYICLKRSRPFLW